MEFEGRNVEESPGFSGPHAMYTLRIGCAGWNIPKDYAEHFPSDGTHLERYACILPAVEINSSFYKPHKPATYERWATSVPDGFQFAVKIPRTITHSRRLKDVDAQLIEFLGECKHLGPKLGPLLVQLPPSLAFHDVVVRDFFSAFRQQFNGDIACEPRHATWFGREPDSLLAEFRVARVAADPAVVPGAAEPGGWQGLVYYRLHGSPRIYYSAYAPDYLRQLAERLREAEARQERVWCIFDNTAEGAAAGDAIAVLAATQ